MEGVVCVLFGDTTLHSAENKCLEDGIRPNANKTTIICFTYKTVSFSLYCCLMSYRAV
jgi:hypothetical protein